MKIEQQLGMRIRYLRNQKHLSIQQLAIEAGVSTNYLCELENGKRNPSIQLLEKIAKGLGITISKLTDGLESF